MIDIVGIKVIGGKGGDGLVSFRRYRHQMGGPDGGDGGDGGNVYVISDPNLNTLAVFHEKKEYKAQDGKPGGKNTKKGAQGEDLYLRVPVGTIIREGRDKNSVWDPEAGGGGEFLGHRSNDQYIKIHDLTEAGQVVLIARGGKGGRGNDSFKSSRNQKPKRAEKGKVGEEKDVVLELKLLADVGIIGLPNAGKSTLLNALTKANAEIGSYPFTTLEPNLGILELNFRSSSASAKPIVLADIPGIIEGASKGRGLGDEFLKHIERVKLLIHVIDPSSGDLSLDESEPLIKYRTIRRELKNYSEKLVSKPEIVVINKIDIEEIKVRKGEIKKLFNEELNIIPIFISAKTGEGLGELKGRVAGEVFQEDKRVSGKTPDLSQPLIFNIDNLPNKRIIFKKKPSELDGS